MDAVCENPLGFTPAESRRHAAISAVRKNNSMTERERWTVYPLLFLALASSLKDRLMEPMELDIPRVRCQELVVETGDRSQVQIVAQPTGGRILISSPEGKPLVILGADATGNHGALGIYSAEGYPLVVADGVHQAGRLATLSQGQPRTIMTSDSSGNGAYGAFDPQSRLHPMVVHRGAEFVRKPDSPLYEIISPFNAKITAEPEASETQAADAIPVEPEGAESNDAPSQPLEPTPMPDDSAEPMPADPTASAPKD